MKKKKKILDVRVWLSFSFNGWIIFNTKLDRKLTIVSRFGKTDVETMKIDGFDVDFKFNNEICQQIKRQV